MCNLSTVWSQAFCYICGNEPNQMNAPELSRFTWWAAAGLMPCCGLLLSLLPALVRDLPPEWPVHGYLQLFQVENQPDEPGKAHPDQDIVQGRGNLRAVQPTPRVPPSAACWSQWRPEDRAANSQCPSEVRLLTAVKIHFRSFCLALGSVSFVRKAKIFLEFSSKGRAPNLSWVFWDWQSLCFLPLVTDTALASGWQLLDTGGEWTQG